MKKTSFALQVITFACAMVCAQAAQADHRIVIDNADASGVTLNGSWTTTNTETDRFGESYLHDQNSGKGSKSVVFTPTIVVEGKYKVYLWWPASGSFANAVDVNILSADDPDAVSVNQTAGGGQWNLLGEYDFAAGTGGSVEISNDGTVDAVVADAVMFVLQDEVVDNDDPSKVDVIGTWTTSTSVAGFLGADYQHDGNANKGTKTFWFLPEPAWPGKYDVFLRWTADATHADVVPVDVDSITGTDHLQIDQQANGGEWILLGAYDFDWAESISVGIGTDGTTGYVIADAVRLSISGDVIDNLDAGFSTTGTWIAATSPSGFEGTNYVHDDDTSKGGKTATFAATIPVDGWYTVYLKWTSGTDRADKIPVLITHANGTSNVFVNQKENGGNWVSLGNWVFGSSGSVAIQNVGTSGYVIADAVKWTLVYDGDNDGMSDAFESAFGLDFTDPGDADDDPDGDGVINLTEFLQGRNPTVGAVPDTTGAVDLVVFTPLEN